jgi:hypothetical protein
MDHISESFVKAKLHMLVVQPWKLTLADKHIHVAKFIVELFLQTARNYFSGE